MSNEITIWYYDTNNCYKATFHPVTYLPHIFSEYLTQTVTDALKQYFSLKHQVIQPVPYLKNNNDKDFRITVTPTEFKILYHCLNLTTVNECSLFSDYINKLLSPKQFWSKLVEYTQLHTVLQKCSENE